MRRSSRLAAKSNAAEQTPPAPDEPDLALDEPSTSALPQAPRPRPPKPVAKSSLEGDALLLIIKSIPVKIDRWQAAASVALAGGFGSGWQEFLEPFWLSEAEHHFSFFTAPPFKTMALKRKAAKIAMMPVESLPLTVPPEIVGEAKYHLLERQVEREIQALEATTNLDAHIMLTRALSEYHLSNNDIAHLDFESRRNPHYRSAAPMQLYTLRDIIEEAYLKHGGAAGLHAVREKSQLRKQKLRETREAKEAEGNAVKKQRKDQLSAALAERGLVLRSDSTLCDRYIEGTSTKSLQQIVDIMHEMDFYFTKTKYEEFHEEEYENFCEQVGSWRMDESDKLDISDNAKSGALSELRQRIGVEGILALPNLPPTIRRKIEGTGN